MNQNEKQVKYKQEETDDLQLQISQKSEQN